MAIKQVARPPPRRTYKRSRRAPYDATRHAHVVYEEDLEGDYEEHYEDKTDDEDLEQESTESGSAPPSPGREPERMGHQTHVVMKTTRASSSTSSQKSIDLPV